MSLHDCNGSGGDLNVDTDYFIVFSCPTCDASNGYNWETVNNTGQTARENWSIGDIVQYTTSGNTGWTEDFNRAGRLGVKAYYRDFDRDAT